MSILFLIAVFFAFASIFFGIHLFRKDRESDSIFARAISVAFPVSLLIAMIFWVAFLGCLAYRGINLILLKFS